ncbi:MAG: A24 family peptidase, partial [Planctomycetaceae bacterium]
MSSIILIALLIVATITDVARHKIYNWTTYPGMLLAPVVHLAERGWPALQDSVAGLLVCGSIMLLCFVLFNVGGGDVKLLAMMGAFLGVERGVEALLWTFVLGSLVGMAILIWQAGALNILLGTGRHLRLILRSRSWIPLTEQERQPLERWLFLAPSGLAATCLVWGLPAITAW